MLTPGQRTRSRPAKAAQSPKPTGEPQGFLLPAQHKLRIRYVKSPLYRGTFLLLLLAALAALMSLPLVYFTNRKNAAAEDLSQTANNESIWISQETARIRPLKAKYTQIEDILKYRRIPLSPILASIQKHIPPQQALVRIQWESTLEKSTPPALFKTPATALRPQSRQATLFLEVFTPQGENIQIDQWLDAVKKDIADHLALESEISLEQPRLYRPALSLRPVSTKPEESPPIQEGTLTELTIRFAFSLSKPLSLNQ